MATVWISYYLWIPEVSVCLLVLWNDLTATFNFCMLYRPQSIQSLKVAIKMRKKFNSLLAATVFENRFPYFITFFKHADWGINSFLVTYMFCCNIFRFVFCFFVFFRQQYRHGMNDCCLGTNEFLSRVLQYSKSWLNKYLSF